MKANNDLKLKNNVSAPYEDVDDGSFHIESENNLSSNTEEHRNYVTPKSRASEYENETFEADTYMHQFPAGTYQ